MYSYPFHYTPYERKSVGVGESGPSYRSGMTSLNRCLRREEARQKDIPHFRHRGAYRN